MILTVDEIGVALHHTEPLNRIEDHLIRDLAILVIDRCDKLTCRIILGSGCLDDEITFGQVLEHEITSRIGHCVAIDALSDRTYCDSGMILQIGEHCDAAHNSIGNDIHNLERDCGRRQHVLLLVPYPHVNLIFPDP